MGSNSSTHLQFPMLHGNHVKETEKVPHPVRGLHELQEHMMQSHKHLMQSNPEAMDSFINKVEERRRQRQKEKSENKKREMAKKKSDSSVNLSEFKEMLKAVQSPK